MVEEYGWAAELGVALLLLAVLLRVAFSVASARGAMLRPSVVQGGLDASQLGSGKIGARADQRLVRGGGSVVSAESSAEIVLTDRRDVLCPTEIHPERLRQFVPYPMDVAEEV